MHRSEVCRYVFALGISPRHNGFNYICGTLANMLGGGAEPDIESALSAVCHLHRTEKRSAERCMRYALKCAWDAGSSGLRSLCPSGAGGRCPPQLSDFLYAAAWALMDAEAEGGASQAGEKAQIR